MKCKINDKEGVYPDQQLLFFHAEKLEDDRTLDGYGIELESTLHLLYRINYPYRVWVYCPIINHRNSYLVLDLEETDTIEIVKRKIEEQTDIPPDQQNLMFKKKCLEDGCTITDYDIQKDSVLVLVRRRLPDSVSS